FVCLCMTIGIGCGPAPFDLNEETNQEKTKETITIKETLSTEGTPEEDTQTEDASEPEENIEAQDIIDASEPTDTENSEEDNTENNTADTNENNESDASSCRPGEIFFIDRCMDAATFCPVRYADEKEHLAQPYEIVEGTGFCKTKQGSFFLPGTGYGACDKDGDGWVTIEGFRATQYAADTDENNTKIKENARCDVKTIDVIQYIRDHYKEQASIHQLSQTTPLIETLRNDGQGPALQAPVYTDNQAALPSGSGSACDENKPCSGGKLCSNGHCLNGSLIAPKHINSLTKACIAGIDLNDNGIQDAKEWPSQKTSPSEFQEFLVAGYFIELHHSYMDTVQVDGQPTNALVIVERPRAESVGSGGLPLLCQNSSSGSDYWKNC
ncbi:MAG: hypothetical protein AAGJ35_13885, partial [Myxococcota bacterium]